MLFKFDRLSWNAMTILFSFPPITLCDSINLYLTQYSETDYAAIFGGVIQSNQLQRDFFGYEMRFGP